MKSVLQRYSHISPIQLIHCGNNHLRISLLRDEEMEEEFSEESITSYIKEGSILFNAALLAFVESRTPFISVQAKELRFMLEALIEAKELLR